jgi:hypothetical protein
MKKVWKVETWDNYGVRQTTVHFLFHPATYIAGKEAAGWQVTAHYFYAWDEVQTP